MFRTIVFLFSLLLMVGVTNAQTNRAPDGELPDDQLVYAQGGDLYLVKFWQEYELEIQLLFDSDTLWASSPEWSTDGNSLAFIGESDGQTDIYLWSSIPPVRLTNTPEIEHELRWSPDDTRLSFTQSMNDLGEAELRIVHIATSESKTIAKSVATCCHRWVSPDTLAFIPLATGEETQLDLDNQAAYLPYDGPSLLIYDVSQSDLGLIYPMASAGVYFVERSPGKDYRLAIYHIFQLHESSYLPQMVIYDRMRNELLSIDSVNVEDVDWRPVTTWPE